MLSAIDFTLKYVIEAAIFITILYLYMHFKGLNEMRRKWFGYSIGFAIPIGIFLGYLEKAHLNREVMDVIWRTASLAVALMLLSGIWLRIRKFENIRIGIIGFIFISIPCVEVSHFFISMLMRNKGFMNTDLLLQFAGGTVAIITAWFLFRCISILGIKATSLSIRIWASLILILYIIRQAIGLFHMFFVLGFIRPSKISVSIIAPFINTWQPVFFYLFIVSTVGWVIWIAFGLPRSVGNESKNPAEARKEYSQILRNKRQLIGTAFLIGVVLSAVALNYHSGHSKIKLSPVLKVDAKDSFVNIPKKELEDGKLHRYGFTTRNNVEVRFIMIKKGDNVYGVGLDACKICGSVGYYQRKDQVICLNCDVIMNIPTIGFPGGCNPIPLEHQVKDEIISIDELVLEKAEKEFKFR